MMWFGFFHMTVDRCPLFVGPYVKVFVETNIYIQPLPSLDQRVVSDMEGHGRELKSSWPNSIASNMPFSVSARICANTDN